MRYLLMIAEEEAAWDAMPAAEQDRMLGEFQTFTADLQATGALVDGARLHPVSTATTVRVRGGAVSATDGPFAETKEQFGGYYLIDVPDLDAAIAWAAKIPSARIGSIEVRPIWEMGEG